MTLRVSVWWTRISKLPLLDVIKFHSGTRLVHILSMFTVMLDVESLLRRRSTGIYNTEDVPNSWVWVEAWAKIPKCALKTKKKTQDKSIYLSVWTAVQRELPALRKSFVKVSSGGHLLWVTSIFSSSTSARLYWIMWIIRPRWDSLSCCHLFSLMCLIISSQLGDEELANSFNHPSPLPKGRDSSQAGEVFHP